MTRRSASLLSRVALVGAVLLAAVTATACESERTIPVRQGDRRVLTTLPCVGVQQHGEVPGVVYDFSAQNIVIGAVTWEFIAPAVVVFTSELYCPTADTTRAATR